MRKISALTALLLVVAHHPAQAAQVCLASEGKVCTVITSRVGFQIAEAGETSRLIFATPMAVPENRTGPGTGMRRFPNGLFVESEINIHDDLAQRVSAGEFNADDAKAIESELTIHRGDMYRIPANQDDFKIALGFPVSASVTPQDFIETLKVHVQISLNVTPLTAGYLARSLGAKAVPRAKESIDPIVVEADTDAISAAAVGGNLVAEPTLP
jgi:hypothetical protein